MASMVGLLSRLTVLLLAADLTFARPAPVQQQQFTTTQSASISNTLSPAMGTLITSLEMDGQATSLPFVTSTVTQPMPSLRTPIDIAKPQLNSTSSPANLMALSKFNSTATVAVAAPINPFEPITYDGISSHITIRNDHPVPRLNIGEQQSPLQTNKFYANFFLGDQSDPTFTHPYSLTWSKGGGSLKSWGMAISQLNYNMKAFGSPNVKIPGEPVQFIINPIGIQDMILSASELSNSTSLYTTNLTMFSANAVISPSNTSTLSNITFPLVQGMGYITAVYSNLTPVIQSGVGFSKMASGASTDTGVFKYSITNNDGSSWLLYAIPNNKEDPKLNLISSTITGPAGFSGIIQVAKNPNGRVGESLYDASAGVYATGAELTGSVQGTHGNYSIAWTKAGAINKKLLMWALPHHVNTFDNSTTSGLQKMQLTTTTKGNATAVVADSWTMSETNLPSSLGFAPWDPKTLVSNTALSPAALKVILASAITELSEDMSAQTNLNSMYYSGKALAKFASIVYVTKDILKNDTLVMEGLTKLETAFALFTTNQQQFPLVYDSSWGGLVSSAGYITKDLGSDFGNTAYNDHHFHYGYFIYAASVISYLDSNWLAQNKDWVNGLVRDVANPDSDCDTMFPQFRMFDWYHGHSWAHGLFAAGDSKDEESSSEDTNFAYAMKMWGVVTGDASMEARGNLMLSVLARSLGSYFLYEDDNDIMPPQFIKNKVSGIMFENKIDHTTYFGNNLEYIQGIHMLPILPHSALIRTPTFVQQEWDQFFADGAVDPADQVQGGWRGILYSNLALVDAKSSYEFFSQPNFNAAYLDGGASLTWYLAYSAGRGGA